MATPFQLNFGGLLQSKAKLEKDLLNAMAGNITREDLDVLKGVAGAAGFFANTLGLKGLYDENKGEILESFKKLSEMQQNEDPLYFEKASAIWEILPQSMVSMFGMKANINETDMDVFVDKVMGNAQDVFKMTAKPRDIAFGYVIEGTSLVSDGDTLVAQVDKQLIASGLQDKVQYFYFRDPSTLLGLDEVQMTDLVQGGSEEPSVEMLQNIEKLESPAILVLPKELKPDPSTPVEVRVLVSAITFLTIASFAGGSYSPSNGNFFETLSNGLTSPILLGILGLSLVHELGHFLSATLNNVSYCRDVTQYFSPNNDIIHEFHFLF